MKKRHYSNTRRIFKTVFNLRGLIDFDRTKNTLAQILDLGKIYFIPMKQHEKASFETEKSRLNLTDDELSAKQRSLFRLSILMLCVAVIVFFYALYQFLYGTILGAIPSCTIFAVALALSFRCHFWYYQIKERKLGCTFEDWRKRKVKGNDQWK